MECRNGKVAFVTDDGSTISAHFGRAQYYEIVIIADGAVRERVRVPKAGHHSFGHHNLSEDHRHGKMVAPIQDCDILVARGMGQGAYDHLNALGITVYLTDVKTIDEALKALVEGTLQHNAKRLHAHGHAHH